MMDFHRTKQILYVVLGVIILGLLVFFVYRFFTPSSQRATTPQPGVSGRLQGGTGPGGEGGGTKPSEGTGTTETSPLPAGSEEQLKQITDFAVVSPSLDKKEEKILFYKKAGGDLFSSDFSGAAQEKVSNITIVGFLEAVWSPTRDRTAVFYLDGETLKAFLQIGTTSIAVLPQDLMGFSWSPDGKSLAYLLRKDLVVNLVVADASAKNQKTIAGLPLLDASLQWIGADTFALQTLPSGLAGGFVFTYSRSSGALTRIAGPHAGLSSLWSPNGAQLLVSSSKDEGHTIAPVSIYDRAGKELASKGLSTLAEKCTWRDTKEIYCAVPTSIPQGLWPDDYLRGEMHTRDRIVTFSPGEGAAREILGATSFDVTNLLVTKKKDFLFFVNRLDGTLWSFKLK